MNAYLRARRWVYELLDDTHHTLLSRIVTFVLLGAIVLSIVIVILSSVQEIREHYFGILVTVDWYIVSIFIVEYVLRVWTCVEDERYRRPILGRLRYMVTPMALIDLVAILPSILTGLGIRLQSLRVARLIRLVRALKIVRYVHALHVIGQVIKAKRHQLATSLLFVTFMLVISSTLMYEVEHAVQPEAFSSIPETMWWAVATLTTVGYGDVYPITALGRLLAAVSAVLGIGLFAIPTGILASGFSEIALKEEEQRDLQESMARVERLEKEELSLFRESLSQTCPHCGEKL